MTEISSADGEYYRMSGILRKKGRGLTLGGVSTILYIFGIEIFSIITSIIILFNIA